MGPGARGQISLANDERSTLTVSRTKTTLWLSGTRPLACVRCLLAWNCKCRSGYSSIGPLAAINDHRAISLVQNTIAISGGLLFVTMTIYEA